MSAVKTISASEFKATCLDLLDQVGSGKISQLTVTKRGKPVAVVVPPAADRHPFDVLFGMMEGSVIAPPGFDFTEPAFKGVMEAAMDEPPDASGE